MNQYAIRTCGHFLIQWKPQFDLRLFSLGQNLISSYLFNGLLPIVYIAACVWQTMMRSTNCYELLKVNVIFLNFWSQHRKLWKSGTFTYYCCYVNLRETFDEVELKHLRSEIWSYKSNVLFSLNSSWRCPLMVFSWLCRETFWH